MDGLNVFINNATKATAVDTVKADAIIRSMVKAVNNGALGGVSHIASMARLEKKRFTAINNVSDIVSKETGYDREDVKKVVSWMVEQMLQTMKRGGMPALMKMVNLMKKGQEAQETGKDVDYSSEIKEYDGYLSKADKK